MKAKANLALATPGRAALYLRVSTGRQAEHDLSIPDQRRQLRAYCEAKGIEVVAEFVEPGASATDDRRPEFQKMMDAASERPAPFDTIIVHSFSRFFRDQFQLEFYFRRLAKNGVKLTSITQDLGDDPISGMMRQIMALFDEYQSKEMPSIRFVPCGRTRARAIGTTRDRPMAIGSSRPKRAGNARRRRSSPIRCSSTTSN